MGLDMMLYGEEVCRGEERDGFPVSSVMLELGYWRKFAPLHCFIVERFAGGVDECQRIDLVPDDLREIIGVLRNGELPPNDECYGFFFGDPEWWDEQRAAVDDHVEVFERALQWVSGRSDVLYRGVYYQASW